MSERALNKLTLLSSKNATLRTTATRIISPVVRPIESKDEDG